MLLTLPCYGSLVDTFSRIWDTRHLDSIPSEPFPTLTAPSDHDRSLYPDTMSEWNEHVYPAMQKKKHAGLLRTESPHDKSCSAAFWDPTGRRVLTTCYDDRIRGKYFLSLRGVTETDCCLCQCTTLLPDYSKLTHLSSSRGSHS